MKLKKQIDINDVFTKMELSPLVYDSDNFPKFMKTEANLAKALDHLIYSDEIEIGAFQGANDEYVLLTNSEKFVTQFIQFIIGTQMNFDFTFYITSLTENEQLKDWIE